MTRPDPDEALDRIREHVEYAICLAAEACGTPDGEGEDGKVDPIHAYAEHIIKDAVPLAVLGLFLVAYRAHSKDTAHD